MFSNPNISPNFSIRFFTKPPNYSSSVQILISNTYNTSQQASISDISIAKLRHKENIFNKEKNNKT